MDAIDPRESDNHDDVVAVGVELLVEESFCRLDEFGEVVEGPIPPSECSNSVRTFGALVLRPIAFHWSVTSYEQVVPAGAPHLP